MLHTLSKDHLKHRFYPDDLPYTVAESLFAKDLLASQSIFERTFLVLHPEIFAGRFAPLILGALREEGFRIHFIETFRLDLARAAEIWRYQWNASSVGRMLFFELKGQLAPAVFLGLSRDARADLPATLALHLLKGSSRFKERLRPHQFRSLLPFTNRAMTFVHCPDEPADFVRELFVLFGTQGARTAAARYDLPAMSWAAALKQLAVYQDEEPFAGFDLADAQYWDAWLDYLDRAGTPQADGTFRAMPFARRWRALASIANLLENERDGAHPLITTKHMPEVVEQWRVGHEQQA
jgi:hypothetical protein